MNFDYIDQLVNDPKAIIYVRTLDGKYVWVNDTYEEVLPFTREQVIGKTNSEIYGVAASRNWEIADGLVGITGQPLTTPEELFDTRTKKWRKYVSTKLKLCIEEVQYIVGISVEVEGENARQYEERLGALRARLIERFNEPE